MRTGNVIIPWACTRRLWRIWIETCEWSRDRRVAGGPQASLWRGGSGERGGASRWLLPRSFPGQEQWGVAAVGERAAPSQSPDRRAPANCSWNWEKVGGRIRRRLLHYPEHNPRSNNVEKQKKEKRENERASLSFHCLQQICRGLTKLVGKFRDKHLQLWKPKDASKMVLLYQVKYKFSNWSLTLI